MRMGQFTGPTGGEYGAMSDYVPPIDMFYPAKNTASNDWTWTLDGGFKNVPGDVYNKPYNPIDSLITDPSKSHYAPGTGR